MSVRLDPISTRQEMTDHPYYRYRGCAPDPDDPRVAAGDNGLLVDAWQAPDVDGGEDQNDRRVRERAAIEVCVGCPVMVQCLAYGSSVTAEGKLAEPYAILGGMTPLDRHRAFVKRRHEVVAPVPDQQLRTPQKLAVLRALAAVWEPFEVAERAGMGGDVRKANWQRSNLVTKLGLARDVSRMRLLAVARERGLLGASVVVVADDGSVPAVPPPTRMPELPQPSPASVALFAAAPTARDGLAPAPVAAPGPGPAPGDGVEGMRVLVRVRSPRRDRFTAIAGQLSLDDLDPAQPLPFPSSVRSVLLEAAA